MLKSYKWGCIYQAWRKFAEVIKITKAKEGVAVIVINMISKIAAIEEEIKPFPPLYQYQQRLEKVKPILDELHAYLLNHQPHIPPKILLGKAVSYTLNQWPKLLI